MPRKGHVKKRQTLPDTRYGSAALAKFINSLMRKGKKSVAEKSCTGRWTSPGKS